MTAAVDLMLDIISVQGREPRHVGGAGLEGLGNLHNATRGGMGGSLCGSAWNGPAWRAPHGIARGSQ